MPNVGFGEILVIVLVALLVFGPRKLPEMGRSLGKALRDFRRAASDLKAEIEDDVEVEPPTEKSAWQRRHRPDADADAADQAPDDAASMPGPDPKTGEPPD